jgi:hypothetical protein
VPESDGIAVVGGVRGHHADNAHFVHRWSGIEVAMRPREMTLSVPVAISVSDSEQAEAGLVDTTQPVTGATWLLLPRRNHLPFGRCHHPSKWRGQYTGTCQFVPYNVGGYGCCGHSHCGARRVVCLTGDQTLTVVQTDAHRRRATTSRVSRSDWVGPLGWST